MIKPFKIKVSPSESAIVQRNLFNVGYSWITGSKEIKHTNENYLFFGEDGSLTYSSSSLSDRGKGFSSLITFEEFMRIFDGKLIVWDKIEF